MAPTLRSRAGRSARGASRPRCRCARPPRRTARGPQPRSFAFSRPSTWKMPDELFIRISIRTGRSSPSVILTSSIAAAESECIETLPLSNGMRERPFAMSSASATRTMPASSVSGLPSARWLMIACSTSDDDHGLVGLLVEAVEQLAQLRLGEEEAEVLVAVAVDRHADAVQERAEHDDDLGVVLLEPVVADEARLDAVLRQLAQQLERDVRDDLDVHPGVVVDLHPRDRVHVRDVPPALELVVGVDALDQRAELAVAADRDVDPHPRDRLGRRQARLALGLGVDRLLDPLARGLGRCRPSARSLRRGLFVPRSSATVLRGDSSGSTRPFGLRQPVVEDGQDVRTVRRSDRAAVGARDPQTDEAAEWDAEDGARPRSGSRPLIAPATRIEASTRPVRPRTCCDERANASRRSSRSIMLERDRESPTARVGDDQDRAQAVEQRRAEKRPGLPRRLRRSTSLIGAGSRPLVKIANHQDASALDQQSAEDGKQERYERASRQTRSGSRTPAPARRWRRSVAATTTDRRKSLA